MHGTIGRKKAPGRNHFATVSNEFVRHCFKKDFSEVYLLPIPSPSSPHRPPIPWALWRRLETSREELLFPALYRSCCHDYSPSSSVPYHIRHWSCCIVVLRPVFRVMFSWANISRKRSRTSSWHRKVLSRYIHHLSYHLTPAQSSCRKVLFTALYISHCTPLTCTSSSLSLEGRAVFSIRNCFFFFLLSCSEAAS